MKAELIVIGLCVVFAGAAQLAWSPSLRVWATKFTVVASFCDVLQFHVAGVGLRIYQPLTVMVFLAQASVVIAELRRSKLGRSLTIFTIFTLATIAWTIHKSDSIVTAVGQVYLLMLFATVVAELRRRSFAPSDVVRWVGIGATLSSVAAVLEFMASYAGVHFHVDKVVGIPWNRPFGLMTEPDWAALVAGMGAIAVFYSSDRNRRLWRLALAVNLLVVLLGGVRDVWVSTGLLTAIFAFGRPRVRRAAIRALPLVFVLGLLGAGALVMKPSALSRLNPAAVFGGSGSGDQGATHSRLAVVNLVLSEVGRRPLQGFGSGTLAYETVRPSVVAKYGGGGTLNAGHGNANLFLTFLWDSGAIGLGLFLLVVKRWFQGARRLASSTPALLWLSSLLVLDFQINNGFRFAFVWIIMAACACSSVIKEPAPPAHFKSGALA